MSQLSEFRKAKNEFFKTDHHSPLNGDQKHGFNNLNYYPENPALRFEVTIEKFTDIEDIAIPTSHGDSQIYTRFGRFQFEVEQQLVSLTMYVGDAEYFLPFVDGGAGEETYPAGRYLEPTSLGGNHFLIDFNYAYNPYCAYNDQWSCPLTPLENRLKVKIRAGEKVFDEFCDQEEIE